MKTAAILTIGDELLIGQVVNSNASFIGQKLSEVGVEVLRTIVVGDVYSGIFSALEEYFGKVDVLLVTGGLGPTHDDITKKVISDFFRVPLVLDEAVLDNVRNRLSKRGIPLGKVNEEQALVPEGCEVLMNHWGTAPGMLFERERKMLCVMPGVPHEMQNLLAEYVLPKLRARAAGQVIKHRVLRTTGIAESSLSELIGNVDKILEGKATLAFLPSQFGVRLRISVKASTSSEADATIAEIERRIREKAGRFIYSEGEVELEEVVGKLLREKKLSVSFAESCTGGYICHRITNISGSSSYFGRGLVVYSNESKIELLNVDPELIHKFGAVSEETARAMASGVKIASGSDIGLSVTGIAGPTGGTPEKPVGLVFIGLADAGGIASRQLMFPDDRLRFKERVSQAALDFLRKRLLGID